MHDDDDRMLSLDASIDALASHTGAPDSFVSKVRALFEGKGISLERCAGPYLGALREAFRREENLRRVSEHSRHVLERARDDLGRLDNQWERQLAELRDLQRSLRHQSSRLREGVQKLQVPGRTVMSPGSVELPFVPGPDSIQ
jgi:hypothetical protein